MVGLRILQTIVYTKLFFLQGRQLHVTHNTQQCYVLRATCYVLMKTPQLPFPRLAEAFGLPNEVWLKREDLHHYGSHKGRSIPLMINEYRKQGVTNFVISSSGNAALAAILAIQKFNQSAKGTPLELTVLVGKNIDPKKIQMIVKNQESGIGNQGVIVVEQCERPKQTAFQMEKKSSGQWLRQSTDGLAPLGYHELAGELAKIPNLSAVFIPTSSGTTAQGLYEGFQKLGLNPEIHIVQTTECHPMIDQRIMNQVEPGRNPARSGESRIKERSLANAIVDKVAHRKSKIVEILKNAHGAGWVATNNQIKEAIKLVRDKVGIDLSPNSALAIVGLQQAIQSGKTWSGAVVCLITGK